MSKIKDLECADGFQTEIQTATARRDDARIAGALYDFLGFLTCRQKRLVLSRADDAVPAVDALVEWANKRGLSLDDPDIGGWAAREEMGMDALPVCAAAPSPWIACSERLPERGVDVLVACAGGVAIARALDGGAGFEGGWFEGDYFTYEATHWMPLPVPPTPGWES